MTLRRVNRTIGFPNTLQRLKQHSVLTNTRWGFTSKQWTLLVCNHNVDPCRHLATKDTVTATTAWMSYHCEHLSSPFSSNTNVRTVIQLPLAQDASGRDRIISKTTAKHVSPTVVFNFNGWENNGDSLNLYPPIYIILHPATTIYPCIYFTYHLEQYQINKATAHGYPRKYSPSPARHERWPQ